MIPKFFSIEHVCYAKIDNYYFLSYNDKVLYRDGLITPGDIEKITGINEIDFIRYIQTLMGAEVGFTYIKFKKEKNAKKALNYIEGAYIAKRLVTNE